jgi:hypothetical protein
LQKKTKTKSTKPCQVHLRVSLVKLWKTPIYCITTLKYTSFSHSAWWNRKCTEGTSTAYQSTIFVWRNSTVQLHKLPAKLSASVMEYAFTWKKVWETNYSYLDLSTCRHFPQRWATKSATSKKIPGICPMVKFEPSSKNYNF